MKHTPTPWNVEDLYYIRRRDKDDMVEDLVQCEKDSDAAFIVKAVNAHQAYEELAQVANRVRAVLNDEGKEVLTKAEMEDMLFKALAKAEGK